MDIYIAPRQEVPQMSPKGEVATVVVFGVVSIAMFWTMWKVMKDDRIR